MARGLLLSLATTRTGTRMRTGLEQKRLMPRRRNAWASRVATRVRDANDLRRPDPGDTPPRPANPQQSSARTHGNSPDPLPCRLFSAPSRKPALLPRRGFSRFPSRTALPAANAAGARPLAAVNVWPTAARRGGSHAKIVSASSLMTCALLWVMAPASGIAFALLMVGRPSPARRPKEEAPMRFRWIAAIALWTILSGPIFAPSCPGPFRPQATSSGSVQLAPARTAAPR